jgi:DNA modification methylase
MKNKDNAIAPHLIWGDAARMDAISDAEADFVFASPPYFFDEAEALLLRPRSEQTDLEKIETLLTEDVETLKPCFEEIARILKPGHAFVLQTKDIHYGDFLIPLASKHLDLAIDAGLKLVTKFSWLASVGRYQYGARSFEKTPQINSYRSLETEDFFILTHPSGLAHGGALSELPASAPELTSPLWRLPPNGRSNTHPYSSPTSVLKRLIQLFSEPGDLVVDPFAGFGGVVDLAASLGRKAIGFEIDEQKWVDRKVNGK